MRDPGLEEHRVDPELGVQQWSVAIHFREKVDALVSLLKVGRVIEKCGRAAWASERPPGGHLISIRMILFCYGEIYQFGLPTLSFVVGRDHQLGLLTLSFVMGRDHQLGLLTLSFVMGRDHQLGLLTLSFVMGRDHQLGLLTLSFDMGRDHQLGLPTLSFDMGRYVN